MTKDMINTLRNQFVHWYFNEFQTSDLYTKMTQTVEGSPWHRERSVGTHTDMVVMEYIHFSPDDWSRTDLLGALTCAFHDVGKPLSFQEKWKEERGDYKSFHGHELNSARRWENYAMENINMFASRFGMNVDDIFTVGFMIEMHKPWDIKRKEKLDALGLTLLRQNVSGVFINVVKADTWGRMSDDATEKRQKVLDWCAALDNRFYSLMEHPLAVESKNYDNAPILFVPIGTSGTGKSTLLKTMSAEVDEVFSLDLMRHELYGEDYSFAFQQSIKDNHFRATCNDRYRDLLRTGKNLFLDNTSTSRKNRRFYINEAKNRGYYIHALLMPVTLQEVIDRQETRTDKWVPPSAVERQYFSLCLPQYGEVDEISVLSTNV